MSKKLRFSTHCAQTMALDVVRGNRFSSVETLATPGNNQLTRLYHLSMLLRPAEPADALAVARVHVRSWQTAYRNLLPNNYLDQLRPEDRAQKYTFGDPDPLHPYTIVATESGVIHGFATTAPARDPDVPGFGELYALYVEPDHWGRGIGVALIESARSRLIDLGFKSAVLWLLAGNVRAERFYRLDRWTADGHRRSDEVWGVAVNELRYQRTL